MFWNHRVMKYESGYGIHEVYYDDRDRIMSYAICPEPVVADTPEGIYETLERMQTDIKHNPKILDHAGERFKSVADVGRGIDEAVEGLLDRLCRDEEFKLLLGTAAVESDFKHRKQIGDGPARGIWQMEPATARDIFENYLQYQPQLYQRLIYMWLQLRDMPFYIPRLGDLEYHLENNDLFSCIMARIHYLRDPDPIPKDLDGLACYWKKVYNTEAGAGLVKDFHEAWEEHGCDMIVEERESRRGRN